MITEDLKRNLVDYLQLVQDIAREIPAQRGTNLLTQYYALKGITNGLQEWNQVVGRKAFNERTKQQTKLSRT